MDPIPSPPPPPGGGGGRRARSWSLGSALRRTWIALGLAAALLYGTAPDGARVTAQRAAAPQGAQAGYRVQSGESLATIAWRYEVSPRDLAGFNGLCARSILLPGRRLRVPLPASGVGRVAATPTTRPAAPLVTPPEPPLAMAVAAEAGQETHQAYMVQDGDTLYAIAVRFGTTAELLQRQNGLPDEAIRAGQTLRVPRAGAGGPATGLGGAKRIEVVVGEQRVYVWEGDTLVWSWLASTGIDSHPTRRGSFSVQSKVPNAWSSAWQLWMPHWLGIYWAGGSENGIHALPILNGVQLWEGSLGTPISYGCVVLGVEEARLLYDWAEIGTPVEIRD